MLKLSQGMGGRGRLHSVSLQKCTLPQKSTKGQDSNSPLLLLAPVFLISRVQIPLGTSPQEWVERNSQLWKPLSEKSLLLLGSKMDFVPEGDVRVISKSPLLEYWMEILDITCSSDWTASSSPRHPLESMVTRRTPEAGIVLQTWKEKS